MPNAVVHSMAEYLPFREMAILSQVNRHNAASLRTFPVRELQIPARLFQDLFSQIHKFPKLESVGADFEMRILPDGRVILPTMKALIETPNTSPSIRTVKIASSRIGAPIPFLNSLVERTPQIKEFQFTNNSFFNYSNFPTQVQVGRIISEPAKANLSHLEALTVSGSNVHPAGLLELLQSSSNYVSLNLCGQCLHNGHLREIVRSQSLTHLNLQSIKKADDEELNFQILSELRNLTHLVVTSEMTEDELIAIIEANPNLKELDISGGHLQTRRVLFKIADKAPLLRSLKFSNASKITKLALNALIVGCPALRELVIPGISVKRQADLSPEDIAADKMTKEALIQALNTLKDRGLLEILNFQDVNLTEDMLSIIISIPTLTSLSIRNYASSQLTEACLLQLQRLTNLEELNLDGLSSLTEAVLVGVVNHCPKLRNLHMNRSSLRGMANEERPTLQPIQTALQEGRLPNLKMVYCQNSGINQDAIDAFRDAFPKLKIR